MRRKLLIGVAPLVVAAVVAVPAAQAVPEIKRFPKIFRNGVKGRLTREPAIAVGTFTLNSAVLGDLKCENMVAGVTYNETTEGTEKGFDNTTGYTTFNCLAAAPCKVKNTKGEEVEAIYATAESPPEPAGTEAHATGISSLPWTGELIERETGIQQVLTKHVKIWVVDPPKTVGTGNCQGLEIPFEDQEGPSEKERGDELAPDWVNGFKNGLKPSHEEFTGEMLTEKGGSYAVTGQLISSIGGSAPTGKLVTGGLGGAWELITVQ
jgi:hypothetical protein